MKHSKVESENVDIFLKQLQKRLDESKHVLRENNKIENLIKMESRLN